MFIPVYQIHNVLNEYSKKLIREKTMTQPDDAEFKVHPTGSGKQTAVMKKITQDILEKVTVAANIAQLNAYTDSRSGRLSSFRLKRRIETSFIYNVLDNNRKTTRIRVVEDVKEVLESHELDK